MIARQKFRRTPRIFVALTIAPAFFFGVRSLSAVVFRDRIEHKTATFFIRHDPAFSAHAFGHQNSHYTRWPDHSGGMKLNKLHVDQFRASFVRERVTVSSVFPTVTSNFISATDPTRGQHDCFRPENFETAPLAFVSKRANHAITIFEQ